MATNGFTCTCIDHYPPVVHVASCNNYHDNNDDDDRVSTRLGLMQNLQHFGWSPLRVLVDGMGHAQNDDDMMVVRAPTREEILRIFQDYQRKRQEDAATAESSSLSTATSLSSFFNNGLTYHTAESGSTEGTVEPKESLEVQLSQSLQKGTVLTNNKSLGSSNNNNNNYSPPPIIQVQQQQLQSHEDTIKDWCRAMSWIAHKVCEVLDLPPNTFLSDNDNEHGPESSLDLLRVFHYYAASSAAANSNNNNKVDADIHTSESNNETNKKVGDSVILGSSPHTDWGSLTIVWQDHIGGLQTYCRSCQRWMDVEPPPILEKTLLPDQQQQQQQLWNVIVHVGDMASLVLDTSNNTTLTSNQSSPSILSQTGSYLSRKVTNETTTVTTTTAATAAATTRPFSCSWPSPQHRVVSSAQQERVSLVYFGYPPATTTMEDIQYSLDHWQLDRRGSCLPLEEYYLLHDQSSFSHRDVDTPTTTTTTTTPKETFRTFWKLPIRDVVRLKWKQVHRGQEQNNEG
jgi:isopenicillin N synthase-like dioxygenase